MRITDLLGTIIVNKYPGLNPLHKLGTTIKLIQEKAFILQIVQIFKYTYPAVMMPPCAYTFSGNITFSTILIFKNDQNKKTRI